MNFKMMNESGGLIKNNDGGIELSANAETDFFRDMICGKKIQNAPYYFTGTENDFIFRCRVETAFLETYDAGGIIVYDSPEKWIKFAFEKTDLGCTSVIAIVTDGLSDDSNGEIMTADSVCLQVVRSGHNWCLHHSIDGKNWRMTRYFRLEMSSEVKVGLTSQSPIGKGCRTVFSEIELLNHAYTNIRKAE